MRRTAKVLGGAVALGGGFVALQARYTTSRRDLPSVEGSDASGTERPSQPGLRTVRLGVAGDSTLTGPGLGQARDIWIRQVARGLAMSQQVDVEVASFAVGGSRVRDVLLTQTDALLASEPDIVVVAVGTNDAIHHTPLRRVAADFDALAARLAASDAVVIFGGVGDLSGIARVPFPLGALLRRRGHRVDRIIRASVARHGVRYIDVSSVDAAFHLGGSALFSPDLFHPNERGHRLWADVASPVVTDAWESFTRR